MPRSPALSLPPSAMPLTRLTYPIPASASASASPIRSSRKRQAPQQTDRRYGSVAGGMQLAQASAADDGVTGPAAFLRVDGDRSAADLRTVGVEVERPPL